MEFLVGAVAVLLSLAGMLLLNYLATRSPDNLLLGNDIAASLAAVAVTALFTLGVILMWFGVGSVTASAWLDGLLTVAAVVGGIAGAAFASRWFRHPA